MTSQLLTRIPTALKKEFEAKASAQGLSMNLLVTMFIESYTKNPAGVQMYVSEETMDEILRKSLSSPKAKKASASLYNAIKSAGL